MTTDVQVTDDATRPSLGATRTAAARRANLRSYTQSLLRELNEQYDHAVAGTARVAIAERVRGLEIDLVAALRGEVWALEALGVMDREVSPQ
jgi:hypothetical protein